MSIELVTLGDSVSQGFMSGAAASTHLSYSSVIAKTIGIADADYHYLPYPEQLKLKWDIELLLRALESRYGTDIRGLEWPFAINHCAQLFDKSESFYERGQGRPSQPVKLPKTWQNFDGFHNLAVEGMDVGDLYTVTPKSALATIKQNKKSSQNNFFAVASEPFSRSAYRTLNPYANEAYDDYSAVGWLKHHASQKGVKNIILWAGANNALGTVLDLKIKFTDGDGAILTKTRKERLEKNLWHPYDFQLEYTQLLQSVVDALANNQYQDWHCYLGTVPLVTIAPIAKGVGEARLIKDPAGSGKTYRYFQYYTYFAMSEKAALKTGKFLKFRDALFIDRCIIQFNRIVRQLAKNYNQSLGRDAFIIVDTSQALTDMAWKRNSGEPSYPFPASFDFLYPPVDTKYYHANTRGEIEKGGVFSLDGVHPSVIGQGLIAHEFLSVMQKQNGSQYAPKNIDWPSIFAADSLRTQPIKLMHELYQHDKLIQLVGDVCSWIRSH
ncbi:hypothetical protein [Gayadomonas joobiniege]|uniref:hypothetical protein n=1 Tax=Gayadomonas joobiniege TaxID=1234606 RepID=UPI00037446A0|nr:hypothetical protein [Gayadomonas joobiniege]